MQSGPHDDVAHLLFRAALTQTHLVVAVAELQTKLVAAPAWLFLKKWILDRQCVDFIPVAVRVTAAKKKTNLNRPERHFYHRAQYRNHMLWCPDKKRILQLKPATEPFTCVSV